MVRRIASVGGLTLASRVVGFVRDILTAAILGAGPVADAFFIAFRLPNHFRALFAEGAFNAAFVPLFASTLVRDGRGPALRLAQQVLAILVLSQIVLLVAAIVTMPWVVAVLAPGFTDDPEKFDLAVLLTRITFPYLLFIALVSLQGAVLNGLGRFAAAAAAPILLNLCLIAALVLLTPYLPTAGHALAWGVFAAGIAQFLYLAWDMRRAGASLRLPWPRLTPGVRRFFTVLGPAALGAGVVQISLFADTVIASLLPTGAVSYLYYADRLNQLPLAVIGIAIGTVLLPELTKRLEAGDAAGAAAGQNRSIELSLLLTLPCAVIFLVAAEPVIAVLFERGAFDATAARQSALTLMAYAVGLPAFVLIRSVLPGFYARGDTATPVRIAVVAVALNVALKLVLMTPLAQTGLALATSAAAWLNFALLTWTLRRRGKFAFDAALLRRLPRLILSAVAMAAVTWGVLRLLAPLLAGRADGEAMAGVALILAAALLAYGAALVATGAARRADLAMLGRRRR